MTSQKRRANQPLANSGGYRKRGGAAGLLPKKKKNLGGSVGGECRVSPQKERKRVANLRLHSREKKGKKKKKDCSMVCKTARVRQAHHHLHKKKRGTKKRLAQQEFWLRGKEDAILPTDGQRSCKRAAIKKGNRSSVRGKGERKKKNVPHDIMNTPQKGLAPESMGGKKKKERKKKKICIAGVRRGGGGEEKKRTLGNSKGMKDVKSAADVLTFQRHEKKMRSFKEEKRHPSTVPLDDVPLNLLPKWGEKKSVSICEGGRENAQVERKHYEVC